MDNEVSEDLKQHFEDLDIQFQLVPSHMHQRNAAEKAVPLRCQQYSYRTTQEQNRDLHPK